MAAPAISYPRLIVSFDVGTTQSAVVVAYLTPGRDPFVSGVDRWPGQEDAIHEAKVPTAVLYDERGTLVACGAEALSHDITSRPAWSQPEHFKMLLHPGGNTPSQDDRTRTNAQAVPLSRVYADYLRYLLRHTRSYLTDAFGYDLWLELEDRVEIVLSHPNSWSERQQSFLQKAAVRAGLITTAAAPLRLHFVEEAEAAACYAISMNSILASKMERGAKFVVCDAGGSTVDISAYRVKSGPGEDVDVEELEHPSCLDAGGIHVDKEFVMHLYEQLYTEDDFQKEDQDYLDGIVDDGRKDFQLFGKRKFSSPKDHLLVRVGGRSMNYPGIHVKRGMMDIESPAADNFFKPFVDLAIETIGGLVERHGINIIIVTGGFSESPYFKSMVETRLIVEDKTLILANHPQSKAVAMGAMKLIAGGKGSMTVQRNRRRWPMWLTNFRRGAREFFGNPR